MPRFASFFLCVGAAVLALLLSSGPAVSQVVTGGGGLSRVAHDTSLTGSGTSSNPLKIRTDCATTEALLWDGNSWECGAAGAVDGSGTANAIAKWTPDTDTLGNSLLTDNGTTLSYNGWFDVTAATGDTSVYGQLWADGSAALDSIYGQRNVGAGSTVDNVSAIYGGTYGTFNTTAGDLYSYGVTGRAEGTRASGANDLNNWGVYGYGNAGDSAVGVQGYAYSGGTYTTGFSGRGHGQATASVVYGAYGQADTDHATAPTFGMYGRSRTGNTRVGVVALAEPGGSTTNIGILGTVEAYTETMPAGTYAAYFKGATAITGNASIGDASGDAHTLTGSLIANGVTGSDGDVITRVAGIPQWATPAGSTYSVISPSATGTLNDYAPSGYATANVVNIAPTAAIDLTGFSGGATGRVLIIRNEGSIGYQINVYHQNGSSTAINRFDLVNDVAWTLRTGDAITFVHDGTQWIMESHGGRQMPGLFLSADLAMGGASITGALNYTGTGLVSTGTLSASSTSTLTGLVTATAGGTSSGNWTTTGTGDLVSGDDLTVADDATITDVLTVNGNTGLGDANTDSVYAYGKHYYSGDAPTLTGCTAACTMEAYSTDARGRIECTDSPATDCTVTFSVAYTTNAPACSLSYVDETDPTAPINFVSITTAEFVFDVVGGAQAHAWTYRCDGVL